MNYDVFISYSRKDTAIADRICTAFDKAGITYFIDRQDIGGGMEFPRVLAETIVGCKKFLFLASANSYSSKFTNSEITFAFNKKEKNSILPYRIDDCEMPLELEFVFCNINWRSLKAHPIETVLVNDMLQMLGRSRQPVTPAALASSPSRAYQVGDYYNNNGLEGIVFDVDSTGQHGKIMALEDLPERLRWVNNNYGVHYAFDKFDGMKNMQVVKQRPNWQKLHPAFAQCAALGDSWYIPAIEELKLIYHEQEILSRSAVRSMGYGLVKTVDSEGQSAVYWSSTNIQFVMRPQVIDFSIQTDDLYIPTIPANYICLVRPVAAF